MRFASCQPTRRNEITDHSAMRIARRAVCRQVRPSLLDLRFAGDLWIQKAGGEPAVLCLGAAPLATIRGLTLDLPTLNCMLDTARHRRPRWRF